MSDMLGPLQDGFELEIRACIGNSDLLEFYYWVRRIDLLLTQTHMKLVTIY